MDKQVLQQVAFVLKGAGFVEQLSAATGIGEAGLRLLLGLLAGYPFAIFYRFFLPQKWYTVKHIFSALSGLWLAFFCYTGDVIHSFLSIIITWLILAIIPNRTISLAIAGIGNFSHLLISYWFTASESYDINFTTAQSVLTLRLIGFAWDYYDGGRPESELELDQKTNGLKKIPSLLETFSYAYFFGGFLIGPQFPFRLYKQFVTGELFVNEKGEQNLPSVLLPTLRCVFLGALYLGFHNGLAGYFPSSYMATDEFLHKISFVERLFTFWIICKVALSKYLGVWLVGEGPCTLVGINFGGYNKDGTHKGMRSLSNVNPWLFEITPNLQGIVESFNINTNDWIKRYVFKRLKWVGDRNVSALSALFFLAIWHGFSIGYYSCFFLEYMDMEAEKKLRRITEPINKFLEAHSEMVILRYLYFLICWTLRTYALHYGLLSFEMKSWAKSIALYSSLYWLGHLAVIFVYLLDVIVPKPRTPKKEQ